MWIEARAVERARAARRCGRPSCPTARRCRRRPRRGRAPACTAPRPSRRSSRSRSSSIRPSWPWLVYGSSATSVMTPSAGKALLQRAHRARHQALGMPRLGGIERFLLRGDRPGTARSRECRAATHASASRSSRSMLLRETPGSEATGSSRSVAVEHEHRIDEIVGGRDASRAYEPAREIVAAHPAHALAGKLAGEGKIHARNFARASRMSMMADGERLPLSSLSGCPARVRPMTGRFGPRVTPLDRGAFFCAVFCDHACSRALSAQPRCDHRIGVLDALPRRSPRTACTVTRVACAAESARRSCAPDARRGAASLRARAELVRLGREDQHRPSRRHESVEQRRDRAASRRGAHRRSAPGRPASCASSRSATGSPASPLHDFGRPPRSRSPAGRRPARRCAARRN